MIKMEVSRNHRARRRVSCRACASSRPTRGIVLIFDECTSGFRQTFGGLHKLYGVEPDMAMFGKTLGNGYAITAAIGRREIMEAAQTTFISSTFWTERIGPTAALKTLEVMERVQSWETHHGHRQRHRARAGRRWPRSTASSSSSTALPALLGFSFDSRRSSSRTRR